MIRSFALAVLLLCLSALPARADSVVRWCEGRYCVQPATSVGWAVNLKTGAVDQASTMVGVSIVRDGGIPFGAGVYGGAIYSPEGASPALSALFSVANFAAIGPGVVMFRDDGRAICQATLNLSLNLNHGGP